MIMSDKATLREIIRELGIGATDEGWIPAIEGATIYAIQLGYTGAVGTGGAYADTEVSGEHAAIIKDLMINTNDDGVYTGDRDAIAAMAADEGTDHV